MLKVFVIEDERLAREQLVNCLHEIDSNIRVVATATTVSDSLTWLRDNAPPDLIFMDVQLTDGLSFDIFRNVQVSTPVIFTTAYDRYRNQAFEYNGIDYLLKPYNMEQVQGSLMKYRKLGHHFQAISTAQEEKDAHALRRTRIVVKRGSEFQTVLLADVVYFFTENKLVFLVTVQHQKYIVNKKLNELEEELDPKLFFRVNRQCIVNVDHIRKFRPFEKSKLCVELVIPTSEEIIVSQENAGLFREWINNA